MRLPIKLGLGFLTSDSGKPVLANRREAQGIADGMASLETKKCATTKKTYGSAGGFRWYGCVWSGEEYHRISLAGQPREARK
jgi:hypothetical protein